MDWKTEKYAIRTDTAQEYRDVLVRLEKVTGKKLEDPPAFCSYVSYGYSGFLRIGKVTLTPYNGECYKEQGIPIYSAKDFLSMTEDSMRTTLTWTTKEEAEKFIGKKVRINKKGYATYGSCPQNPAGCSGTITHYRDKGHACPWVHVNWDNGKENSYEPETLDLVEENTMTKLEKLKGAILRGETTELPACEGINCDDCPLCAEQEPDLCDCLSKSSSLHNIGAAIEAVQKIAIEKLDEAIAKESKKNTQDEKLNAALLESIKHWEENKKEAKKMLEHIAEAQIYAGYCALCTASKDIVRYTGRDQCSVCVLPKCDKVDSIWKDVATRRTKAEEAAHAYHTAVCNMLIQLRDKAKERGLEIN